MVDKVHFLPVNKHESFLQYDNITLGAYSQACPEYPKQQVCNIFAISQGKTLREELDFLPADKRQRFLQIDTIILGLCYQACLNYPK